jgi:putative membrane protein
MAAAKAQREMGYRLTLAVLTGLYLCLWSILAIAPRHRDDWMLENALVVVFVAALLLGHRRFPLSRLSYVLIFVLLSLHAIGAHYTYAEVPYDEAWRDVFGFSLNEAMGWQRNHFDRLVHFVYGLTFAYPMREVFLRIANVRGFWGYFLPLDLTMSTSMLYELIEWGAASLFGGELGMAYLGTQGDVWDSHRDMALASLGALLTMSLVALVNGYLKRDFAREWNESLRIKSAMPLGDGDGELL